MSWVMATVYSYSLSVSMLKPYERINVNIKNAIFNDLTATSYIFPLQMSLFDGLVNESAMDEY